MLAAEAARPEVARRIVAVLRRKVTPKTARSKATRLREARPAVTPKRRHQMLRYRIANHLKVARLREHHLKARVARPMVPRQKVKMARPVVGHPDEVDRPEVARPEVNNPGLTHDARKTRVERKS